MSGASGSISDDRPIPENEMLPIGAAARRAGISIKRARHYEAIGLLPPVDRARGGKRVFSGADIHTLRFIGRARSLGFPLNAIRKLLSLWQDSERSNADILRLSEHHMEDLLAKRAALDSMIEALQQLIDACAGDGRPDCPILDDLADTGSIDNLPID